MNKDEVVDFIEKIKKITPSDCDINLIEERPSPFESFNNKIKKKEDWKKYKIEIVVDEDD